MTKGAGMTEEELTRGKKYLNPFTPCSILRTTRGKS
jgi:hypothetical protein